MEGRLEDRIRALAYALSEDPARSACTQLDNWLEAERLIAARVTEKVREVAPGQPAESASSAVKSELVTG